MCPRLARAWSIRYVRVLCLSYSSQIHKRYCNNTRNTYQETRRRNKYINITAVEFRKFPILVYHSVIKIEHVNWAASWQNQQCGCAPSEDSDQPGHPPSLIRVFAVRMKKAWVLSYPLCAQRRLWSDWADAQADLSLRWAHTHFVCFVTRRLLYELWCLERVTKVFQAVLRRWYDVVVRAFITLHLVYCIVINFVVVPICNLITSMKTDENYLSIITKYPP